MVNDNDTDAVLLDYFSELLRSDESEHKSASTAGVDSLLTLKPQACLQVKVGEQGLLFQLADLSGMQALCGPLIAQADTFWQSEKHSDQVLLDLRPLLSLAAVEYNQSSWQGHSLKFKQPQLSVLVDTIIGPVHSQGHEQWQIFNGVCYSLMIN